MAQNVDARSLKAFEVIKRLERLGKMEARIAVKAGPYPRGQSVTEVAQWLEYGTERMPPRPFMQQARYRFNEVKSVLRDEQHAIVFGNRTAETAIRRVAQKMGEIVVNSIDDARSWAAPLAQSTVEKKGHDRPLIETEHLRDAIHWQVVEGGAVRQEGQAKK